MRRLAVVVALVCVPCAAAAPQPGVSHVRVPPGTPRVQWGAQLFGGNCIRCHCPQGTGLDAQGPSVRDAGARAADFYLRTGYMPLSDPSAQPRRSRVLFSRGELAALVEYVASLGHGPPIPHPHPERGSLSDGQALFTDHCAGCHQVGAQGGYVTNAVAPPLDRASPVEIAEAVRIGPYLMPHFSEQQIDDRQLDSIIRYVRYAKHPDDRGGWALGHVGPVPEGLVTWFIAIVLLVATCAVIGQRIRS
jgi:ubiquinol-cytochrome c reductase cytochrome c subunit